jgi:hypothetical protein
MRKTLFTMASLVLVLAAAGCSTDYSTGLNGNITASFTLQTFNGAGLPALFDQNATQQRQLVNETFTLYANGTYTDDYRMRTITASGSTDQTFEDTGVYSQNNTALQFRDTQTGDVFTGSITGNTLTITQFGDIYVFSD